MSDLKQIGCLTGALLTSIGAFAFASPIVIGACATGTIEDRWELFEIAGPDNLMEVLDCRLSEYQWDVIYDALDESNFEYYIGDKVYVAKNNKN